MWMSDKRSGGTNFPDNQEFTGNINRKDAKLSLLSREVDRAGSQSNP